VGGILSWGPFLYAYFIKQSSFFHEHAVAGLTHELKARWPQFKGALEYIKEERHSIID